MYAGASISLLAAGASAQNIAPTEALSPTEQRAKFHLPAGFEIQLVLSDPDIGQPMNLNFDARGRLWVTHSIEYPYPAAGPGVEPREARFAGGAGNAPRDRLTVVESIAPNGKAKSVTHFTGGLNIPIGNTPLGDGAEALVYAIPSIFHCADTSGDGQADRVKPIYTGFGNRDTHGMANSFTRWVDGWIYGCHGFSNASEIKDGQGNVTQLRSGNTYRFQSDGSRFQQFTFGQVNPFGLTFDPLGNLFVSDCHSMPVYLLIRGARYPHFGAKPDGLGFGPTMIDHNHGSTGICGPAYYAADHFPADYRDNLFICNPVTGRVHRDKLKQHGSTYLVDSQPDFVRCDDPWFRPVDAIVGPDGALYIADFYNAIIGHYEVELKHPKRDRNRGRVWRIVYRPNKNSPPPQLEDLTQSSVAELVERLGDPNLQVRTLATNYLLDAHPNTAAAAAQTVFEDGSPEQQAHAAWVLERLGQLKQPLASRLIDHGDPLVLTHLMRIFAERSTWSEFEYTTVRRHAVSEHPFVARAAADALGLHPHAGNAAALLACWNAAEEKDTHRIYTVRLALRTHLRDASVVSELLKLSFKEADRRRLLSIAAAAESPVASAFLFTAAQDNDITIALIEQAAEQIAQSGDAALLKRLITAAQEKLAKAPIRQAKVLSLVAAGMEQRGDRAETSAALEAWCQDLAPLVFAQIAADEPAWTNRPLEAHPQSISPWGLKKRACADGTNATFIDSIVHGEQRTGVYRSRPFTIPAKLEFWMCGHNGRPGTNGPALNHVRLKRADSGQIIAQQTPPRNDTAQKYSWDLSDHQGTQGVLEIVDADPGSAYAWIAVSRWSPAIAPLPQEQGEEAKALALEMVGRFGPRSAAASMLSLADAPHQPGALRVKAATAAIELGQSKQGQTALQSILIDATNPFAVRRQAAQSLGRLASAEAYAALVSAAPQASAALQRELSLALCTSAGGAQVLLETIIAGKASPRNLQDQVVSERFAQIAGPAEQKKAAAITADLPSVESHLLSLIEQRRRGFAGATTSLPRGEQVFKKHCAACHRFGPTGPAIGPQLDGVHKRGVSRLLEDLLDPNRNVDAAFRTLVVVTDQGKVINGLKLREEGEVLILADQQAKEVRIPRSQIDQRRTSPLSLMPSNLAEALKPQELYDLLAWLQSQ